MIAIIAILAAILFPVFAKAREKARTASCGSNVKQMGLAFMQYVQDYDETWPQMNNPSGSCFQVISPYIKSTQVFACPSNVAGKVNHTNGSANYPPVPGGYGVNCRVIAPDGWWGDRPYPLAANRAPAQKILMGELRTETHIDCVWLDWDAGTQYPSWGFAGHNGMSNYLFCDGHVKTMKPTATMQTFNHWGWFNSVGGDPGDTERINYDTVVAAFQPRAAALEALY